MSYTAILVIAVGTYLMRLLPAWIFAKSEVSNRYDDLMRVTASVILVALVALLTFFEGDKFAGWARVVGVAAGGGFALAKVPFILVVVGSAAVTALLRLAGVA